MRAVWIAVLIGCLGASAVLRAPALAQDDVLVSILDVDDRAFPDVSAIVTVDRGGRPVAGLAATDLQAREGDAPASVLAVQRASEINVPLAVVVTVDTSGSMRGEPIRQARSSATALANNLERVDHVAVLTFSDQVRVVQPLTQNRAALSAAIARLQEEDRGTALYDAVVESARLAGSSELTRRAILLLSDGEEAGGASAATRAQSLAAAVDSRAPFYVVGLGPETDRAYLQDLAALTQGRYFTAPRASDVPNVYAALEELLRSQFAVAVRSSGPAELQDRFLQLSVTQGAATASAERRYQSRRPPVATTPPITLWIALLAVVAGIGGYAFFRRGRGPVSEGGPVGAVGRLIVPTRVPRAGPPLATMVVTAGPGPEGTRAFSVGATPLSIGSAPTCAIHLPARSQVAAEHARVWLRDDRLILHHVAASGETTLRGEPVVWASVQDGDEIGIGSYRLRCSLRGQPAAGSPA